MRRSHVSFRSYAGFALVLGIAIALLGVALTAWRSGEAGSGSASPRRRGSRPAPLVLEVRSDYSHIRLRRHGNALGLHFVRDNGVEALQTLVDLNRPHHLQVPYTQVMFATYLVKPAQERVLMLGLGGGAMIHFISHYHPELKVDAVEIDPVVIRIAEEHFGIRSEKNVRVVTDDAFRYVRETGERYDAIYLDTFLKPSPDTDSTGKPLKVKTLDFYKDLQARLSPGGVVAFNLNRHDDLNEDLQTIREAFPHVYVFRVDFGNIIVLGATSPRRVDQATLRARAAELDRRLTTNFSFQAMLRLMARDPQP